MNRHPTRKRSINLAEMRRLVLDGVGDRFSVFHGRFPFGRMLDDPGQFFGEGVIRGRGNGDVADLAVFTHRELIMDHGGPAGHRWRNPEMGNDVCLEERYAILENGRRIDVVRFDVLQESAVFFAQLDIGEYGFCDPGRLCILVGLAL